MAIPQAARARPPALGRLASHYLPDLVYGANDGIITTFAVVSGVVGASLSESVIIILGFATVQLPGAIALTAAALFAVGASRTFVTRRGLLRGGVEMLLVGSLAAAVAFGIGGFTASFA